jgi:hypothetical protein
MEINNEKYYKVFFFIDFLIYKILNEMLSVIVVTDRSPLVNIMFLIVSGEIAYIFLSDLLI